MLFVVQPGMLLVTSVTMVFCWLAFSLSTRTPSSFCTELFLRNSAPSVYWSVWGSCSALPELCISLFLFLSVQCHTVSMFTSSNFTSSLNLLRVHFAPLSRFLMKRLNNIGLLIDPWGTPPVSCLPLHFVLLITTPWAWLISHIQSTSLSIYQACTMSPFL